MIGRLFKSIVLVAAALIMICYPFASSDTQVKEPAEKLVFQIDESHPPFEFASGSEIYGFGVDLAKMIFSAGNYNIRYSSDTWSKVYERIKKGEIDVCGLLAITDKRKQDMLFSAPVVKTFRAVYGKRDMEISTIEDIKGYRIGVQASDCSEIILQSELGIKDYLTFSDLEACLLALKEGSIDIVLGNQEVTNYLLVKLQMTKDISPHLINLYPMDLAYGIKKTRPDLAVFINEQIEKLQTSGLYEQIFQKHFYRHSEYYKSRQQKALTYLGLFLTLAAVAGILFTNAVIRQLRKMVSKATSNLKKERELLHTTLLSITDGVIAVDSQSRVTFMNYVAEKLTGFSEEDSVDRPLEEILNIIDTDTGTKYQVPVKEVLEKKCSVNFNCLNILQSREGSRHLILGSASPIKNDAEEVIGVLVVFQDISEKKQSEETIKYHEYYDNLTDLPNRKLLLQYLNSAVESADRKNSRLAILIVDLDHFKSINNSLGHEIGDKLLKQAAERLFGILNGNEVLARMGGDEFTILMPHIEETEQVYALARRAIEELSREYIVDEHELYITASIGLAVYPEDGHEPEILLKHAGTALHTAKTNGKNTYRSYTILEDEKVKRRFSLTKDLHMALEHNEMLLHYQPKINGDTGAVIGMEALVRWQHPEKGIIGPDVFIPLAEEIGLIKQLDTWVLKTACLQFLSLKKACGYPLRLSVNLSACQFRNHNLVDTVEQVLRELPFVPSELELEITETTAMENLDFTIKTLSKLNEMGVNISIDDFGTGYSSLNYLRYFPINILKIDKSFICDMERDLNTKAIVKSIIDVAHSLNLKVTAEGVETSEQLSLLKQMECDEMQGFLISKPLPLIELQKYIQQEIK